jgi:hypothetical protein
MSGPGRSERLDIPAKQYDRQGDRLSREAGLTPAQPRDVSLILNLRTNRWGTLFFHTVNDEIFLEGITTDQKWVFDFRSIIEINTGKDMLAPKAELHHYHGSLFTRFGRPDGFPGNDR